jgi:hypothetical protein
MIILIKIIIIEIVSYICNTPEILNRIRGAKSRHVRMTRRAYERLNE